MADPFSLVYDKLWEPVEAHPDLLGLGVRVGNRSRLDDNNDRKPIKDKVATADLPELLLMPQSMNAPLHATSNSSKIIKRYLWVITTGDMRVDEVLFPLSFLVLCAMTASLPGLKALEWPAGHKFVRRLDMTDSVSGQSELQRQANIRGWSAVQTIEVEMSFGTSDLIAAATP